MVAENVMTPEEKLLHAIQKGSTQPTAVGSPGETSMLADDSEGAASLPSSPHAGGGFRLRNLTRVFDKGSAGSAAVGASGADAMLGGDLNGAAHPPRSPVVGGFRLRSLTRLCALAAVLLAAGAAYEIYANLPTAVLVTAPPAPGFLAPSATAPPPRINGIEDIYAKRRIFGLPGKDPIIDLDDEDNFTGWRAYIRDHFKFIGHSAVDRVGSDGKPRRVDEAIVVDSSKNLMHFLSSGQALVVDKTSVAVESVSGEEIIFVAGEIRMPLKK